MRRVLLILLTLGVGLAFTADSADAQRKSGAKRRGEVIVIKGPARTRVTVTRPRSYLDAGTEVLPGERKFTDYVFPPNHRPSDIYDPTGASRFSLPRPWDLPGFPSGSGASF
jgi:hypothetical protein